MEILVAIGILLFLVYVFTRAGSTSKRSSRTAGKTEGRGTNFLPPIPDGYQIFEKRLSVTGIKYRREDALRFANASDQTLAMERDATNAHDANAIKVIGIASGMRHFIGYIPREVSEQIVGSGLADVVRPRLERIWRSGTGYVDVMFQVVGPKEKKSQYLGYLTSKPAGAEEKEFLKFFELPIPKGLTSGQAAELIEAHRTKLEVGDLAKLDEWDAFVKIRDEFDDADFRDIAGLKKVSAKILNEAIDALKSEGETMSSLADDVDKVADKVLALRPELQRK